jgi:hypothetical protein
VATFQNPDALVFVGKKQTHVSAWVCCSCGYTELYADAPASLRLTGSSQNEQRSKPSLQPASDFSKPLTARLKTSLLRR